MKFTIKLENIKSVESIAGYWNNDDYRNLLELFDFGDTSALSDAELFEMLSLAISDFEPPQAAEIVLAYKLSDHLNTGQIENLAHEMLLDKIAEEYPEIPLHYPLYNINQLLYKAYNGKFPKTIASIIDIELSFEGEVTVDKDIMLRTLSDMLTERSLLKRLFSDKLDSEKELKIADGIIWELHKKGENKYQLVSSDYWFNRDDFETMEFSGVLSEEEIEHEGE
ncbi:MAG: hypothetical protein ACSHW7_13790 [Patiriisocius sp.]|uniref:hypothetical protein n=1 Tax=Patiriisocius sp. TaxID=2822396 RepID=UPI003EF4122A